MWKWYGLLFVSEIVLHRCLCVVKEWVTHLRILFFSGRICTCQQSQEAPYPPLTSRAYPQEWFISLSSSLAQSFGSWSSAQSIFCYTDAFNAFVFVYICSIFPALYYCLAIISNCVVHLWSLFSPPYYVYEMAIFISIYWLLWDNKSAPPHEDLPYNMMIMYYVCT